MRKGFIIILLFTLLCGCVTTIPLRVQRRPTLDTAGITRITVLPFETVNNATTYQTVAQHATNTAQVNIARMGNFSLINSAVVNNPRRPAAELSNYTDALFGGQINNITEETTSKEYTPKKGEPYTIFTRQVSVELTYSLTRTRDGVILGPISKRQTVTSSGKREELQTTATMANSAVESMLGGLQRDLAPYYVTTSRTLEKESDKLLKPDMERALAFVKGNNYTAARDVYLNIWRGNSSVAAAINASILYEAQGDTQTAATFMQQIYNATGSPKAYSRLSQINAELAQQEGIRQYIEASVNPTERVTTLAFNEILRVLPSDAKLWVYNNTSTNISLTESVVNGLVSKFINRGIAVLDRQWIDLIIKEQNFQLSGYVHDDDIVGLGKLAGANTIIVINVTGSGNGRRLTVRVLDIATGVVKMQSDNSTQWSV